MKRLIYYIENKIACRFLRRELDALKAGKVLVIAYETILKEAIREGKSTLTITHAQKLDKEIYNVTTNVTWEKK